MPKSFSNLLPNGSMKVRISYDAKTNQLVPDIFQVKRCFEESDPRPLFISIREKVQDRTISIDRTKLKEYFDLCLGCVSRWQELELWAPYVPLESLSRTDLNSAPLLEVVRLKGPPTFDISPVARSLFHCLKNLPVFRRFTVEQRDDGTLYPMDLSILAQVSLHGLHVIRLDTRMSAQHCVDLLILAENATDCAFGNVTHPGAGPVTVLHTSLRTLRLVVNFEDHRNSRPTYLSTIFDAIRAPELKGLIVKCDNKWNNESFIRFLEESGCYLESTNFIDVSLSSGDRQTILSHSKYLRVPEINEECDQVPPDNSQA
ncbi:hypothetical protein B0H34DRAFT_800294 [Crassisporium funariophilum]|nr:hypothetical protein B0H34DRAFT_800294 [Crassisporium funariophilum]